MPRPKGINNPAFGGRGDDLKAKIPTYRIAVNADDYLRIDEKIRKSTYDNKLDLAFEIHCYDEYSKKTVGIPFDCTLVIAACSIDAMRIADEDADRSPTRAYILKYCHSMRANKWFPLPSSKPLTLIKGSSIALNKTLFPEKSFPLGVFEGRTKREKEVAKFRTRAKPIPSASGSGESIL